MARFVALSSGGDVLWERRTPADRWTVAEETRLGPGGGVLSRGYTYARGSFETPLPWSAQIDASGLAEEVGAGRTHARDPGR